MSNLSNTLENNHDTHAQFKSRNKSSRKTLLAIIFVSSAPIVLAYFMFFTGIGVPNNTVNAGSLLDAPFSLENLLKEEDFATLIANKKWRILQAVYGDCLDACSENLYTTHQVHVRLSEKGERLARMVIYFDADGERTFDRLKKDGHPYLYGVSADRESWKNSLGRNGLASDQDLYFLVDQEGHAMMSYTTQQHGNELLKDLKRALKFSIDYQ